MNTRRSLLIGMTALAGFSATAGASNTLYKVLEKGPRPKLIKGNPDKVDLGHGLLVPMNKEAFHALWEGDDRWITYGHGMGSSEASAMGRAEEAALGTMKLYLITLAFAPDRLMRVDGGGWVLKSGNTDDLVKGDVPLPGRPLMPTVDHMFGYMQNETAGGSAGDSGHDEGSSHATTGWLLWKEEVNLDYVRAKAQLL